MANSSNHSLNLLIHDANGQQQIIKITRNANSQPLTQEGVKAIVKEVTGHDSSTLLGQKVISNSALYSQVGGIIKTEPSTSTSTVPSVKSPTVKPQSAAVPSHTPTTQNATEQRQEVKLTPRDFIATTLSKKPAVAEGGVRRRRGDRIGKGLRHFSMKVCEKVKQKGTTTYNEVADELVAEEVGAGELMDPTNYDQKNIRRRVYDALNVLMAMNIISKDKKEIKWIGLPTNSAQQCSSLELENEQRKERIALKQQQLRDLILQQVSFKSLITRNKEAEDRGLLPTPNSVIQLPFIIVNAHKKTHINCTISDDKSEFFFKFDDKFEIHDDIEVLKKMGLLLGLDKGECTYEDIERAKTMVPKSFEKYIEIYGRGYDDMTDDWDMNYIEFLDGTKLEPQSDVEDVITDGSDAE